MSTLQISSDKGIHELRGTVNAPIRAVWDVLSDTDRINHVLFDLPTVDVVTLSPTNIRAKINVAGIDLEFDELPWSWDAPHGYRSVRIFHGGPVERLETLVALEDCGAQTEVRYSVTLR